LATLVPSVPDKNLPIEEPDRFFEALLCHWGYESFRPGQENIVRSIAAGRDACIVMPTGGGKSLCYQLPAVLDAQRTVVVVSPLIALMQDQVAQLEQMGIPAGFLNSSLSSEQRSAVLRHASEGHYRLLYLSPERIALDGTPAWLGRVPVSFFAIDEAHCISEWGHDFRPEYRQLSRLRELFPDRPIAAFTASATQRVRHDIIEQLRLREPYKHIASFRRPNLRYIVRQCDAKTQDEWLLRAVKQVSDGSIVVYSPTVARVGDTVDFLEENGVPASAITARWKAPRGARTRKNGWPMKCASWSAPWPSAWHQQSCCARGDSSLAAEECRAVLPGSGPSRPRCAACRLLLVLAKKRYGLTRVFYRQDRRPFREGARLAALP